MYVSANYEFSIDIHLDEADVAKLRYVLINYRSQNLDLLPDHASIPESALVEELIEKLDRKLYEEE